MGPEDLYNRILFKTDRAGAVQVYSMNPDGSDQRPVQNPLVYNELAPLEALSPDGRQQVVVRTEANAELWLVSLDGSESEWRITYTEAFDYDPVWSPVGDLVAFVSEQTGNGDVRNKLRSCSGISTLDRIPAAWIIDTHKISV